MWARDQDAGHALALGSFSSRFDLALVVGAAILVICVSAPVMAEALRRKLSKQAARAAPSIFLLGLAVLLTGLVVRIRVLDIVGGALIGALVIGAILDNY